MSAMRGGKAWVLTLSCGHIACRSQLQPTPGNILMTPLARFLAPRRVKCLVCS